MTELDEALKLVRKLGRETRLLERFDAYLEGDQPLRFVSPILERETGFKMSPIVLNLASFAVDVYDNRLDIEGFRVGTSSGADEQLWSVWQENEGPFLSQQSTRESLGLGRSYVAVGAGDDDDLPLITIESAFDAIHEDDPRTKQVRHGLKRWRDPDGERWLTYFHREGTVTFRKKRGRVSDWVEESRAEGNDQNLCALVPLMNDPRALGRARPGKADQRLGKPVFHPVVPVLDALNKTASDMMTSAEFHAMPRRWATGVTEDDFVDENGNPLSTFEMMVGRVWGVENDQAKFGQFTEASLSNFHETIKLLMQIVAMQLGLPAHYLLFQGDNPPSADAIRSSESQLVKRAERKQQTLSTRWEQVQRLVLMGVGRAEEARPRNIETIWRDPSTPTVAQKADAIVKLVQARDASGRSVLPIEQARNDLGYTPLEQERMQEWDQNTVADVQLNAAMRELENVAGSGS